MSLSDLPIATTKTFANTFKSRRKSRSICCQQMGPPYTVVSGKSSDHVLCMTPSFFMTDNEINPEVISSEGGGGGLNTMSTTNA